MAIVLFPPTRSPSNKTAGGFYQEKEAWNLGEFVWILVRSLIYLKLGCILGCRDPEVQSSEHSLTFTWPPSRSRWRENRWEVLSQDSFTRICLVGKRYFLWLEEGPVESLSMTWCEIPEKARIKWVSETRDPTGEHRQGVLVPLFSDSDFLNSIVRGLK